MEPLTQIRIEMYSFVPGHIACSKLADYIAQITDSFSINILIAQRHPLFFDGNADQSAVR